MCYNKNEIHWSERSFLMGNMDREIISWLFSSFVYSLYRGGWLLRLQSKMQSVTQSVQKGDRVRVTHHDVSFHECLHRYSHLSWSTRMATYIGKVGIVKEVTADGVRVTFFSWGRTDSVVSVDDKSSSNGRITLVEATYMWHRKSVLPANSICLLDGDRAILVKDKDLNKATIVSVRVADADGTLSLRLPHSAAFLWNPTENPNDVIIPVYTGRSLMCLMRDRNLPSSLTSLDRTPARVVFGAPPAKADPEGLFDALRHWADTGDDTRFRLTLYRHPELKNSVVDDRTPLMAAVELGHWSAVAVLLCIGADKVCDSKGNSVFHIAASRGHARVIEGLLIFSADDVNRRNAAGETALHCAAKAGHAASIDRLLNAENIDPNIQDNNGDTVLHILSEMEDVSTQDAMLHRMLSNVRLDYSVTNNDGLTAFQTAIVGGQARAVESMIRMKPSLLATGGRQSFLPLHLAAAYARSTVLDVILKYSPNVSKTTKANRTALHFAVERWDVNADRDVQRLACIQTLVSLGVPLNVRDCDGATALHLAAVATQGQPPLSIAKMNTLIRIKKPAIRLEEIASKVRPQWPIAVMCFLLAHGCDPRIRDRSGFTPINYISERSVSSLFKQYVTCRIRSCAPMSSSPPRDFDSSEVTMCTFNCDDNVANVKFVPCGHRVVCTSCADTIMIRRCPLCYRQITSAVNSDGEEIKVGAHIPSLDDKVDKMNEYKNGPRMIDEEEVARLAREAAESAKRAVLDEDNALVNELRDKLEQLGNEMCCPICMEQRCSIVLQCGHTVCADCGGPSRLKVCHICRRPIKRRTMIYN